MSNSPTGRFLGPTTLSIVAPIVHETYGDGDFVQAGAEHIAERVDFLVANPHPYRSLERELLSTVWNFFPGGSTAETVTDQILQALDLESRGEVER